MKTLPPLKSKVRYRRVTGSGEARECTGTVTAHYPGGDKCWDSEAHKHYLTPHHAAVKVDKPLPAWWPYNGTDFFAPEVGELTLLT